MGPRQGAFPTEIPWRAMAGDAVSILSVDPNFGSGGPSRYTGVPLQRFLDRAGVGPMQGVTVIGRDQYAVYIPAKLAANPQVVIVSEREGQPLTDYRGGPLKLLFPPDLNMHLSAYCWYVETLIPDYYENPGITVRVDGNMRRYTPADLDALLPVKRALYLSIPAGYRWDLPKLVQPSRVTGLKLGALFTGEDLSGKTMTLTPFSGRPITLPVDPLLSCEVLLVYRINDEAIHPSMGGPFSVYFPVMTCAALEGIAPETASLFFLNEISID
ncbi:hypothetical protein DSLASN_31130 [Desulfoluna limicola]|uniref:Oxidoreductase molybdopterin-binding domain-containing protein n=1 Tax=Desulfoluna limicola TaxID=2810562 RepID=A0ABM7PJV9_9BACT|nr:molybdopterin-dependent oxidoreductase [Desulfoluna limicola]BCS97481.1 hypothetical protein DSLASN_31130 [Desulfoluna limicola]